MQRTSIDCCSDNAAHVELDQGVAFVVNGGGQGCRLLSNVLSGDLYRGEDNLSGQFLDYRDPCDTGFLMVLNYLDCPEKLNYCGFPGKSQ